jgi:hypothetical protein
MFQPKRARPLLPENIDESNPGGMKWLDKVFMDPLDALEPEED